MTALTGVILAGGQGRRMVFNGSGRKSTLS